MNKNLSNVLKGFMLLISFSFFQKEIQAQSFDNGIFFQALARDNYANPAKDRKIYVQATIIQSSITGTKVLVEEFQTSTDASGVFGISIGKGNRTGGSFSNLNSIDWSAGPYFLNLQISITPVAPLESWNYAKDWIDLGTTSFGTVPYALHAKTVAGFDTKLNVNDTAKMLLPYAKSQALTLVQNTVNTKLNTADSVVKYVTPTQLANSKFDTTSLSNRIDLKANALDVNTTLNLKANTLDVNTALDLKANTAYVLSNLAPKASPALLGVPTAPTASPRNNSTQIATTAYTDAAIAVATAGATSGVADNSVTSAKILDGAIATADLANGAVTDAKIISVSGSKVTGVIPVTSGGTGQTSVAGIKSILGFSGSSVAIGDQAGLTNPGSSTVGVGGGAGATNQGVGSVAVGYVAGYNNQGSSSVAIGSNAAQSGQGTQAVALGYAAGQNGQGAYSVAVGSFAGNVQAANSIALNATGTSLNPTTTGFFVAPVRNTTATSTLLYYNSTTKEVTSGTGTGSFVDLTTAQTIAGVKTFSSNINVNGVLVGRGNGNNDESVAIGSGAMGTSNVNGKRNTAVGYGAMARYNGTSWDNNTSIGYNNLPNITSGSGNTSVGAESMMANITGVENTSVGNQSLINTTGNNNVGIGKRSGQTITTGSQNTIVGTNADVASNNLSNATAIGYGANVATSNTVQLGNTDVTNVKTSGSITVGAGASSVAGTLVVGSTTPTGSSAALEVKSTSQGLLLPRLTTTQRDAIVSPEAGLLVYNTSSSKFQGYSSTSSALQQLVNTNQSYGLGYMNDFMMGASNSTDGQTFTVAATSMLNSIEVNLNNSGGNSANVTISVFAGDIGAAYSTFNFSNPIAASTKSINSTGNIQFDFTPISLAPGHYYFNVTCDNMNYRMGGNTGGGFSDLNSIGQTVNELFFQTGGSGYNNFQGTTQALYFRILFASGGWVDLN